LPVRVVAFLLLCLHLNMVSTVVSAQARASLRDVDPNLIFELLGTANTVEVELPPEVAGIFVYGMKGEELVVELNRAVAGVDAPRGARLDAVVSAGAIAFADGADCAFLGFARLALREASGREYAINLSRSCIQRGAERSRLFTFIPRTGPLENTVGPVELPLDRWLAFEAFGVNVAGEPAPTGGPEEVTIFYLYLDTDDPNQAPEPPSYATWQEIREAYESTAPR
jgi:hypothetical protein